MTPAPEEDELSRGACILALRMEAQEHAAAGRSMPRLPDGLMDAVGFDDPSGLAKHNAAVLSAYALQLERGGHLTIRTWIEMVSREPHAETVLRALERWATVAAWYYLISGTMTAAETRDALTLAALTLAEDIERSRSKDT